MRGAGHVAHIRENIETVNKTKYERKRSLVKCKCGR